jgi:hypothetical protein
MPVEYAEEGKSRGDAGGLGDFDDRLDRTAR